MTEHQPNSASRSPFHVSLGMSAVGSIHLLERGGEWRIPEFSSLPSNWRFWSSPPFQFGGQRWHLRMHRWDLLSCVAVYLQREASPSECHVTCEVGFRKADGTMEIVNELSPTFGPGKERWECFTYTGSDLDRRRDELVPSDQLTVVCHMRRGEPQPVPRKTTGTGLENPKQVKEPSSFVEASTQTVSEFSEPRAAKGSAELTEASTQTQSECSKPYRDLTELLLNGEDSDLTVKLKGDVEFRLHRLTMEARAPVDGARLRRDVTEKATNIVFIDDCEAEVFRTFVRYVNYGRVDQLTTDTVFRLFALADKFQVDFLRSACLDFIQRSLSVDTFCDVVTLALTCDQRGLLQQATDFLAQNMEVVLQTVKWVNFMKEHCAQANELMLKAVQKNNAQKK